MENQDTICRLCLKECGNDFKVVEENATEIMNILDINVNISEKTAVCMNCMDNFKKCLNFKSTCIDIENSIVQFCNLNGSNAKLYLKDVYLSKKTNVNDIPEDQDICRLCMISFETWSLMSLDNEDGVLKKVMVEKCLPELDLCVTERPVICVSCYGFIQHYYRFIVCSSMIEEKIKKYCDVMGIGSTDRIKLKDVVEFTTNTLFDKVDGIKMEDKFCNDEEQLDEQKCSNELLCISGNILTNNKEDRGQINAIKLEQTFCEEGEIKIEPEKLMEVEELDNHGDDYHMKNSNCQENINELKLKDECVEEILDQKFTLCDDEVEVKPKQQYLGSLPYSDILAQTETTTEIANSQKCPILQPHENLSQVKSDKEYAKEVVLPQESASEVATYYCDSCAFQTKHRRGLAKHKLRHNTPIKMYNCASCSFETKYKWCLERHMLTHNPKQLTMYQCDSCSYQTKHKDHLKTHSVIHKNPSEIPMYQCEFCPFQTKRKNAIVGHLLKHKNPSEVPMHQCDHCNFQTKHKHYLKSHLLSHKSPSEVAIHSCDCCSFTTRNKYHLKAHLLTHENSPEVTVYRCDFCSFLTKYKNRLNRHLLIHKSPSEITMFQCDYCSFRTKRKHHLKTHLATHKNTRDVMTHICEFCPFRTNRKNNLSRHLMTHTDPAELPVYHCEHCNFQTRHKPSLKPHLLTHRDILELVVHQCASCSFNTQHEHELKAHLLTHKDVSEIKVYRCDSCSFQTKFKPMLKRHSLVHKDPGELTMYECEHCSYQSKYKHHLIRHLFTHNSHPEATIYRCDACSFRTKFKKAIARHVLIHENA